MMQETVASKRTNENITACSVIIVTWNSASTIQNCLESIRTQSVDDPIEVIVVDNHSFDHTTRLVKDGFPEVNLVANETNTGFAAANNRAAMIAKGRYLLLLNPDTEVPPGAFHKLIEYADSYPEIGVLGPRLVNSDGSHQRSCWRGYPGVAMALIDALYLWTFPRFPIARLSEYTPEELTRPCDVDHLLGACLLIRRAAWEEVGPFDEVFFLFLEETDWCWRARRNGWRVVYYPDVTIVHHGQHSMRQQPSQSLPQFYRSYCRFYRKHHPRHYLGLVAIKALIVIASLLRIGLWTARTWRANRDNVREQGCRMIEGYKQVLRELPSF